MLMVQILVPEVVSANVMYLKFVHTLWFLHPVLFLQAENLFSSIDITIK
jgi:hypothetical protein